MEMKSPGSLLGFSANAYLKRSPVVLFEFGAARLRDRPTVHLDQLE